jgi:hypothetical protein
MLSTEGELHAESHTKAKKVAIGSALGIEPQPPVACNGSEIILLV